MLCGQTDQICSAVVQNMHEACISNDHSSTDMSEMLARHVGLHIPVLHDLPCQDDILDPARHNLAIGVEGIVCMSSSNHGMHSTIGHNAQLHTVQSVK